MLGKWEMDRANASRYERFLAECGYPWFMRQFMGRAMQTSNVVVGFINVEGMGADEAVSVCAAGTFMGYNFENVNRRLPPMMFPFKRQLNGSRPTFKWKSVGRPPTGTYVAKVCYRFVNTHDTIAHQDGSCYTELIHVDPNFGFKSNTMKMFDKEEMKRWVEHLHDTDPATGLPKQMQKETWDRRVCRGTTNLRNGCMYLDWQINVFEYDSISDDWSKLRTTVTVSSIRQGPYGTDGLGRGAGSDTASDTAAPPPPTQTRPGGPEFFFWGQTRGI
jgi:hypothetical protein